MKKRITKKEREDFTKNTLISAGIILTVVSIVLNLKEKIPFWLQIGIGIGIIVYALWRY